MIGPISRCDFDFQSLWIVYISMSFLFIIQDCLYSIDFSPVLMQKKGVRAATRMLAEISVLSWLFGVSGSARIRENRSHRNRREEYDEEGRYRAKVEAQRTK